MSFNDVFKSSFLEKVASISMFDMVIAIFLAFALGLFIMGVYKKTYRGVLYSQSFCISLMAMSLITTIIILAVTANVVLSLGMVGALSIVRFRSAIKEPLDIAFLFWSISVGIIVGAGFIELAVFGSIVIGVLLVVLMNKKEKDSPYMLVTSCLSEEQEEKILQILNQKTLRHMVKAKTVTKEGIELTTELRLKDTATSFVNEVSAIEGVHSAVLVSYNGEYLS